MRTFRLLLAVLVGLSVSTPASAQFKKLKDAVAKKAETSAAPSAPQAPGQAAGQAGGGTIVVTPEVVDRLLAGAKARDAEREKALKEDTPYGRYHRAKAAYATAESKCNAAKGTWAQRLAANEKLGERYSAVVDKAMKAQEKGDMAGYEAGMYEALAIVDPSCQVKEPQQPEGYSEAQRAVNERAEQAGHKATGFEGREYGLASDRVIAILTGNEPPGGASASEKTAVKARDPELKAMYGIREAQEERLAKQAPAADTARVVAPTPAPAPIAPPAYDQCMVNNIQRHEKQIQALGDRGSAAQEAGNTALMMAIADTIRRIQMAGCGK